MAAIADVIVPGDGLPSASKLGLHSHMMALPDLKDLIANAITLLDRQAALQGGANFLALGPEERLSAVDAAFASNDAARQFVLALRRQLMTAYYSESSVKAAFAYTAPPQPDGFPDFLDRPK